MGAARRAVRRLRLRAPEHNHGTSGALKNAIDYLYVEWNNKAAGFVAYGSAGGTRAADLQKLAA